MNEQSQTGALPRLEFYQLQNIYNPAFDVSKIPSEQKEEFKKHAMITTFDTAAAVILHFVTLGIFTFIFFGLKHTKLPRIKPDDFSGGKAIGFLFIPFFNFYWVFVFWGRLVDRINFQFKLRNQPAPISKGLIITAVSIGIIPYLGIISWLFIYPVAVAQIQSACNKLAMGL